MRDIPGPLTKNEMVPQKSNRPPMQKRKPTILVHDDGFSGWGRRRELGDYKGDLREGDFHHEHGRFYQEGVDSDE